MKLHSYKTSAGNAIKFVRRLLNNYEVSYSCRGNLGNNFIWNSSRSHAIQSTESEQSGAEMDSSQKSCTLRMPNITEADWCNESESGEIIEFTGMQIALCRINYLACGRLKKQQQQAVAAEASV
jgi:hypothetical protein